MSKTRGEVKGYFWISLEGTDGVGKTTFSKKIFNYFASHKKNNKIILINEFSNSEIGKFIKQVINKQKFFALGNNINYPISETLLLISDLFYQFEKNILARVYKNKNIYIISDRGPYSFLTYQTTRLKNKYGGVKNWDKWIIDIFNSLILPDISICLVSDIEDIKKRLVKRGDKTNARDLEFIKKIQNKYISIFKKNKPSCFIVKNLQGQPQKTLENILNILDLVIKKL